MRRFFKGLALVAVLALSMAVMFGCGGTGGGSSDGGNALIVGIEPGAGIMKATENAIQEYGLDFTLQDSSSAAMAAALKKAVAREDWIVVTGWTPHWKFASFDLKYLEDPKGVFGGEEEIVTLTRKGFKEDNPVAYALLDNFNWKPEDMEAVMLKIEGGMNPDEAATQWIDENRDEVETWIPEGQATGNSGKVTLGYVEWDSEVSSTHVVKNVLEEMGFEVEAVAVDAGIMFTGIGKGDFDALVSCWLPGTHADYYDGVKDKVDNLGPNLKGAKIGLVVPTYVTIDSIDELNSVKDKF